MDGYAKATGEISVSDGRAWAREPRRRLLGHRPRHRPDRSCGSICDIAWLVLLVACVAWIPLKKRTQKLQGFLIWIAAFAACEIAVRYGMAVRDIELAQQMPYTTGFVFLGLLGLALARITVPVTNLVLDPTETTSPFPSASGPAEPRARPCRAGDRGRSGRSVRGSERLSQIAAGAAFMDRVGKAFIGRAGLRAETMVPALSSFLAGSGLVVIGIARLAASFPEAAGLHAALMGLGLGVLAVFSIAGQLHPGQKLRFAAARKLRSLLVGAVAQRVLPDLGLSLQPPGPPHALAALSWAATFLLWLKTYWPALSDADTPVGENLLKNAGAAYPFARDLQSCCAAPSIRHVPACHLDDDFTDGSDETAMPFS